MLHESTKFHVSPSFTSINYTQVPARTKITSGQETNSKIGKKKKKQILKWIVGNNRKLYAAQKISNLQNNNIALQYWAIYKTRLYCHGQKFSFNMTMFANLTSNMSRHQLSSQPGLIFLFHVYSRNNKFLCYV